MAVKLDDCTEFGKIVDIYDDDNKSQKGLFEFLKEVVMNNNMLDERNNCGYGIMLKDFSNIYVLVSKNNFPFHKLSMNQDTYINFKRAKRNFVLGYIWLCPWEKTSFCNTSHYINFIDTRISNLNLAEYMMHLYESRYETAKRILELNNEWLCNLLPYEIPFSSAKYWKQHFSDSLCVKTISDVNELIKMHNINPNEIKWNELYVLYDTDSDTLLSDTDSDTTLLDDMV